MLHKSSPLSRDEAFGVLFLLTVAAFVLFTFLTPSSRWMTIDTFDVQDAETYSDVTADYTRTINREFQGAWRSTLEVKNSQEEWVEVCTTPNRYQRYHTKGALPIPVTLEWLIYSEQRCKDLPAGEYRISRTWLIWPRSWLFEREILVSDEFIIWGDSHDTNG